MTERHAPEPPPPGTPTHRLIRLSRADSSWLVLPHGEVSVDTALGRVWKHSDGSWRGRREVGGDRGNATFDTRAAAAEWVAQA